MSSTSFSHPGDAEGVIGPAGDHALVRQREQRFADRHGAHAELFGHGLLRNGLALAPAAEQDVLTKSVGNFLANH